MKIKQASNATSTEFSAVKTLPTDTETVLKSQSDTEVEPIADAGGDAIKSSVTPPNIKLEMYDHLVEPSNTSPDNTDDRHNQNPELQLSYFCEQCDFR